MDVFLIPSAIDHVLGVKMGSILFRAKYPRVLWVSIVRTLLEKWAKNAKNVWTMDTLTMHYWNRTVKYIQQSKAALHGHSPIPS